MKNLISFLKENYRQNWYKLDTTLPSLGISYTYGEKIKNERNFNQFIKDVLYNIESFPAKKEAQIQWKADFKAGLYSFLEKLCIFTREEIDLILCTGISEVTKSFMEWSKAFDSNIKLENVGQAMRNLWIMNLIQLLLQCPVELTPSAFAYSLLYPYTDNYLDDPAISLEEKRTTCAHFKKRLEGTLHQPTSSYEAQLFSLVSYIEEQYSRRAYPSIYESLLAIHDAQTQSLVQQKKETLPYETDVLGMSIEKGGISVLADAYLVKGNLKEPEVKFFFDYGVLLQFSDDLQDVKTDFANGSSTIFTQLLHKWPLDRLTNRLFHCIHDLLDNTCLFSEEKMHPLKSLIQKNCILLVLHTIALQPSCYSRTYRKIVKQYYPFRPSYMRKLSPMLRKVYKKLNPSYNGVSLEEIIFFALEKETSSDRLP